MSDASLINTRDVPPGGWRYREVAINWEIPDPMMPLDICVAQLQQARLNNLHAGLNTSYASSLKSIGDYTCKRLNGNPRWCSGISARVTETSETKKRKRRCASCGGR